MGLTVEQIAQRAGLTPDYLDRQISDQHVLRFAEYCTDFELVGPYLGLKKHEVSDIDEDKRKTALKRRALLEIWKERQSFEATYRKLIEALMNCGKNNSAYEICCILAKRRQKLMKELNSDTNFNPCNFCIM